MHWGSGTAEFVRPVHWLVMMYGKEVLPARLLDIESGNHTQGHRFHAPRPIKVSSPSSYETTLRSRGYVIADFATRRELIRNKVVEVATSLGGTALIGDDLLDEVTALVEWPVPLAGRFEERFLAAAARGVDFNTAGSPALFRCGGFAGPAVAEFHHGQQHREPRSFQGARR